MFFFRITGTGTLTRPCVLTLCTIPENSSSVMKNGISGFLSFKKRNKSEKISVKILYVP